MQQWEEKRIPGSDPDIVWYEIGTGPEVLFLHGNWDHILYMPMLEEQQHNFRTLLLKQRGSDCWKSPREYNTLPLRLFLEDIEHLRAYKGGGKLTIVGHSWGATLGLHYACMYTDNVRKLVLIGLGPLSDEMAQYYRANVRKMVHPDKLDAKTKSCVAFCRFDEVKMFREEFASGRGVSRETDEEYADVYSTVWAYSPEKADEIKAQYLNAGGFRRVAAGAPRGEPEELLNGIEKIKCPVLIIYGYQDYEPITQAYMLKERIPNASISFINRCGHFVWIDQPDEFYRILNRFING